MIAAVLAAAALALQPGSVVSFESSPSVPADWKIVEYVQGAGRATVETGKAAGGTHFLRLSSSEPNHTRLMIPADVEPNAIYRFTARIRGTGAAEFPAYLAIDSGDSPITEAIPGDGEWHRRDLYVRTGASPQMSVALSYGWFGNIVAGEADFDRLKIAKVDAIPDGATVADAAAASAAVEQTAQVASEQGPRTATIPLIAVIAALCAGCGVVLLRSKRVG